MVEKRWFRARLLLLSLAVLGCDRGGEPTGPPAAEGFLQVTVTGVPASVAAAVVVTGPGGYSRALTASKTLSGLSAGPYEVRANWVATFDGTYKPVQAFQTVSVPTKGSVQVNVAYALDAVAGRDLSQIIDSIRSAFNVPALAGVIVTIDDPVWAWGVAGTRRATGGSAATVQDLWHLGSNFKAFTAMLAAIAVERGVIEWTTTVLQAFPELAVGMHAEYRDVTLRELLSHQSGFPRDPAGSAIVGATRTLQRNAVAAWAVAQAPASIKGTYSYSNLGYMLAGAMIERALSTDFESAMSQLVFGPLGITDADYGPQALAGSTLQPVAHRLVNHQWQALEAFDNPPVYASAGGVHMSAPSWASFLREVLRVEAGTSTIVSPSFGLVTTTGVVTMSGANTYALGWIVTNRSWADGRTLSHSGSNTGNHSVAWMAPLRGFAVLALTNCYDGTATDTSARALDAVAARLIAFHDTGH
jgi:CubicO group peptidase (beta-lactamase class C family)